MLLSHGFSRKKIQHIALQRLLSQRAAYMADISLFSRNMLVWVDETGCDKRDMLRRYGYLSMRIQAVQALLVYDYSALWKCNMLIMVKKIQM